MKLNAGGRFRELRRRSLMVSEGNVPFLRLAT